ncbi:glycoside hydrolase [Aspergillus heteromorphus CBS 117.55]|uniref:chitinase n=1 Tax=Aspergillus heteromorphus CBS 117.55 TaxID=1448321 RepID=A0A317VF65_9EURO|nr:glycoside hydrolase [Aspergillus heteromorphus CBS 117.55]PWY73016.1 glycoside hydrolase [Aspergillus heteromorphus CBS 117.55]
MLAGIALTLLVGLGALPSVIADTSCSATVPCEIGCCDKYGVCGMGPDFCGTDVCVNSCDAKAECNPGGWPSEYVNATTCPLDVCCSEYGFCGTTEEFCGNKTVTAPSCDASSQSLTRVIGYYSSAGAFRACDGMAPYAVPQGVYSHIYFAFGSIDPDTFEVIPAEQVDELLYPQLAALQTRDLGQELWLSIGGWDFSDSDEPTATTFSDLAAADTAKQNVFFKSLINFMSTYGFTGVDIDWEYPAASDRNGRAEDYENYPTFLANLKKALADYKYGLSITLPTSYWYLQHFDLTAIEPSVDWFNVMSYDLHGTWDIGDIWTGAYLDAHTNLTEIKLALDLLWGVDIKPSKINLGLAFYGRSYTISSASCSEPGCSYVSAADAGTCSDSAGILFNSEIEDIIAEYDLTPTLYEDAAVKTITWDSDQWVSFDDEETWKLKAEYAKSVCLGGVMVWSIDEDDSNHTFSVGLAAALGNKINIDPDTGLAIDAYGEGITATSYISTQDDYCRFINCGETCPSGFSEIVREDKKSQIMLDSTECLSGSKQTQTLCCPTSSELPTCRWRGFHNSGKCKGGCESDEAEVGTITAGCHSGYQSACCTITRSTEPWSECAWTSKCESDETCPSGYDNFVVGSRQGWGGRKSCSGKKNYNYCCKDLSAPDAFTNCEWKGHEVEFPNQEYCTDACPSGSIRIAEESIDVMWGANKRAHTADCLFGNEAYCCAGTTKVIVNPRGVTPTFNPAAEEFYYYFDKFLSNPSCPANWDAEYSASFFKRSTSPSDVDLLFNEVLAQLVTWISSIIPPKEKTDIYTGLLKEYGFENTAPSPENLTHLLYGMEDIWTGAPIYDANTLMSQTMCDIYVARKGVDNLAVASDTLCELPTSSTLSKRMLDEASDAARSVNDNQPTVLAAINGVLSGNLAFHYARWLESTSEQVILELAFWIGETPGTTPTADQRARFADRADTRFVDRWIVFHFHIGLDARTFLQTDSTNPVFYPGITAIRVYHGQTLHTYPGGQADPRAEYVFSNSYRAGQLNVGAMQNYNARSEVLRCRNLNSAERERRVFPHRWYIGRDRTTAITEQARQGYSTVYVRALNQLGLWLHTRGFFSPARLALLWPRMANYVSTGPDSDGFIPAPSSVNINGRTDYRPQSGAFATNWAADGSHVDISESAPVTP